MSRAVREWLDHAGRAVWWYPWRIHVQHAPAHGDGPDAALKYLAQYASGTAIQNIRIVGATDTHVTIQYKDYRRDREVRQLTLSAARFVERFAQHILPRGLTRVRYTGIFHGAKRKKNLAACHAALKRQFPARCAARSSTDMPEWDEYRGPLCPCCGAGGMQFYTRYKTQFPFELLEYTYLCRQRISSECNTLSLPGGAMAALSAVEAGHDAWNQIAWHATLTDQVLVGYLLPEPEP